MGPPEQQIQKPLGIEYRLWHAPERCGHQVGSHGSGSCAIGMAPHAIDRHEQSGIGTSRDRDPILILITISDHTQFCEFNLQPPPPCTTRHPSRRGPRTGHPPARALDSLKQFGQRDESPQCKLQTGVSHLIIAMLPREPAVISHNQMFAWDRPLRRGTLEVASCYSLRSGLLVPGGPVEDRQVDCGASH